jgi:hypothetical protein
MDIAPTPTAQALHLFAPSPDLARAYKKAQNGSGMNWLMGRVLKANYSQDEASDGLGDIVEDSLIRVFTYLWHGVPIKSAQELPYAGFIPQLSCPDESQPITSFAEASCRTLLTDTFARMILVRDERGRTEQKQVLATRLYDELRDTLAGEKTLLIDGGEVAYRDAAWQVKAYT